MIYDKSRLIGETIEGCILQIISAYPTYGYDIVLHLRQSGLEEVREGTVYPLLNKLENIGMLDSKFCPTPMGVTCKHYYLTQKGEKLLESFISSWDEISQTVENILSVMKCK